MKQKIFIASLLLLNIVAHAQTGSTFYGMARNATSSTDIFLATVNPATGVVTNIGTTPVGTNINLTGAALDPYNNNFYYVGGTDIKTVNLTTGAVTNTATLYSSTAGSYFDNYRFNNSDTTLYGLARTVTYDTDGTVLSTGVGLATVNTATGLISVLSATPVAAGFSMGGTAIDPYQKVFYFTNGLNFIGIDMYDGSLFSSVPITITDGVVFDNIAYSCADTTIYGLIRQNYYDTTYDAADSSIVFINVDSTTIHLGKIDPSTGIVTTISPYSIASGGYSLNAGATIDPSATVYYYNNGSELVGVSLATGLVVSNPTLSNTDGEYFDLMRIHSNCITATTPIRGRTVTGINGPSINSGCSIYPNPATNSI
ncbi:MAG: hypothetical protein EBZ77_08890, partial [Chitinophagia bacterium]|nr:hypothetical protein [Chitinophagia bacterium]